MTAEVTPGGFNLDSHQEVGWLQLVWLELLPATQRFTSCTDDTLPVTVDSARSLSLSDYLSLPNTRTHTCWHTHSPRHVHRLTLTLSLSLASSDLDLMTVSAAPPFLCSLSATTKSFPHHTPSAEDWNLTQSGLMSTIMAMVACTLNIWHELSLLSLALLPQGRSETQTELMGTSKQGVYLEVSDTIINLGQS